MENDYMFWSNFWTAMSAIGSISVAVVAIGIVKWQDIITNKKDLKIEWRHVQKNGTISILLKKRSSNKEFDGINIKFVNIGNRKIVLDGVSIEAPDGRHFPLLTFWTAQRMQPKKIFPCILETETASEIYLPNNIFLPVANQFDIDKILSKEDEIIIIATDTTGKIYRLNTQQKLKTYLHSENPDVSLD